MKLSSFTINEIGTISCLKINKTIGNFEKLFIQSQEFIFNQQFCYKPERNQALLWITYKT
jgi:hypothetical protein